MPSQELRLRMKGACIVCKPSLQESLELDAKSFLFATASSKAAQLFHTCVQNIFGELHHLIGINEAFPTRGWVSKSGGMFRLALDVRKCLSAWCCHVGAANGHGSLPCVSMIQKQGIRASQSLLISPQASWQTD